MSRKIKLLPVDLNPFNMYSPVYLHNPVEILAPRSYEATTDVNEMGNMTGVLGNALYSPNFFYSRNYDFNWIGPKKDIDLIRTILTQSSSQYFLFGGLEQNPVLTPTVMYNSKAMLASLVDQYKPPQSRYETVLNQYAIPNVFPRGSTGVQLAMPDVPLNYQFDIIPEYATGAEAYFFLEKGKKYTWRLDFNFSGSPEDRVHPVLFSATIVELGTSKSPTRTEPLFYDINSQITLTEPRDNDSIVRIQIVPPDSATSTNTSLRGWANYTAPIIFEGENFTDPEQKLQDSYEEKPSLLTLNGSGVYNVLSNNLAEFSCNFQEVVNAVSR